RGCQCCVSTTCRNVFAMLLINGITSLPRGTARLPPGQKSFCTSTTRKTSRSPAVTISVNYATPFTGKSFGRDVSAQNKTGNGEERHASFCGSLHSLRRYFAYGQ